MLPHAHKVVKVEVRRQKVIQWARAQLNLSPGLLQQIRSMQVIQDAVERRGGAGLQLLLCCGGAHMADELAPIWRS